MIYTQQRRKALNKATKTLYPYIKFYESANGVPVMECAELPAGARRVESAKDLFRRVDDHCVRVNEVGLHMQDYGKALPVFIRSMELEGRGVRHFYRVNYVSVLEGSKQRAAEYIAEGKLYAVLQDTCNP